MGFPKGEKRQLFPLVEHRDSNRVFDITWFHFPHSGFELDVEQLTRTLTGLNEIREITL